MVYIIAIGLVIIGWRLGKIIQGIIDYIIEKYWE
jgi:hypothetical protein